MNAFNVHHYKGFVTLSGDIEMDIGLKWVKKYNTNGQTA